MILEDSACPNSPVHHWRIEDALTPVSSGVCKHCGAIREFKNERKPGQLYLLNESDPGGPGRARSPVIAFRR